VAPVHRSRPLATAILLAVLGAIAIATLGGCLGKDDGSSGAPNAHTTTSRLEGTVKVERIVYSSSDGSRVPALLVIPRGVSPRGCLIWENGLHSTKEGTAPVWQGAAALGLAVFSIDLRHHGERARSPGEVDRAVADPRSLAALVRGTVTDLTSAVDYLEDRRECRHNIGYAGLSLGGMIGSVLSGRDQRIRAAVIMSTPPSWRALIRTTDQILPGVEKSPKRLGAAERILSPLDPARWIDKVSPRPVMVLIGRHDPLVPPAAARQTERAAQQPKVIVNYRGDHIPLAGKDAARNAELIAAFLLRWLVKPTY
jgi:uncharacterized protein